VAKGKKSKKKGKRPTPAKLISLEKRAAGAGKTGAKDSKRAVGKPEKGTPQVSAPEIAAKGETTTLARIGQLEADRTNLMAQVAWARAVAQEQQKTLEVERQRAEKLAADLEAQRARIEQLKALSVLDRLLGRHKRI
jgi:hypothetical protein